MNQGTFDSKFLKGKIMSWVGFSLRNIQWENIDLIHRKERAREREERRHRKKDRDGGVWRYVNKRVKYLIPTDSKYRNLITIIFFQRKWKKKKNPGTV